MGGSEKSIREFLYIEDAVGAYLKLSYNIDITKGNAYNIGSGVKITIEELLKLLLSTMDSNLTIEYKDKEFPEISHQYLDSTKIKNDIKWESSVKLESGISETIQFYANYYDKS